MPKIRLSGLRARWWALPIRRPSHLLPSTFSPTEPNTRPRARRPSDVWRSTTTRNRCLAVIAPSMRLKHGRHRVRNPKAPAEGDLLGSPTGVWILGHHKLGPVDTVDRRHSPRGYLQRDGRDAVRGRRSVS